MASLKPIVLLSSLLSLTQASPLHHPRDEVTTFENNVVFVPPSDYTDPRVLYARTAELTLNDNVLLGTWENYSPEPPLVYFPIYKSVDHGKTWEHISNVTDDVNGWGLRYQPFIYELPVDFGGYKAGTVLVSGNSIPTDLSETKIDVYASTDAGYTWEFVSSVARGGEALPNNGLTPIWEPYIDIYEDQLVLYYSDQRDPDHGQKLLHQTTSDLLTWDDPVDDVAYDEYTDRPGMTTIAQLPSGDYMLVYEWGHDFNGSYSFPVTYRINSNPLDFDNSKPVGIRAANTGTVPTGSPYVVWSSVGGENGTIIVSCGNLGSVFTNQALGAPDQWYERETPQPAAYTRHLRVFAEDPDKLLINGAGKLPPSTTNEVSLSVVSIEELLSS